MTLVLLADPHEFSVTLRARIMNCLREQPTAMAQSSLTHRLEIKVKAASFLLISFAQFDYSFRCDTI